VLKHALAATATVAPHVGALLTVFRIIGSFKPPGGNAEEGLARTAEDLGHALVPLACGLAIGILAKLAHRDSTARVEPMGAGIDIASHQLTLALTPQRFKILTLDRGGLDTLTVVAAAAELLAALLLIDVIAVPARDQWSFLATTFYNGTLAVIAVALALAQFNRRAYKYLETQHRTLQAEMEPPATDRLAITTALRK